MHKHIFIANKLLLLFSQLYHGKLKTKHSNSKSNTYLYEVNHHEYDKDYLAFNWTKSAIKQFLYYISIANPEGEAYFVEDSDIIAATHLSLRTIEENNRAFQKGHIITFQRVQGRAFHIAIRDFQKNVRDVYEIENEDSTEINVNTGYTAITKNKMKQILSIENVNELRFVLRGFVWYEKDIYLNENKPLEWFVSADRLFTAVPKYLRYPSAIKSIVSKVNNILPFKVINHYEDLKNTFSEYGNRGQKVVEIFKQGLVGILSKFEDSKSQRLLEQRNAIHEFNLFKFRMKKFDISVQDIELDRFNGLLDKYGIDSLKASFKRIEGYFNTFKNEERQRLISSISQNFESFLYSIIKRVPVKSL